MRIGQALQTITKPFLSCEFYPPAEDAALGGFFTAVDKLTALKPLFVSVTYGAGGSKQDRTLEVAGQLAGRGLNVMSHLTCVGAGARGLEEYLGRLCDSGIDNVLALRGDPPKDAGWKWHGPFRHASDLVSYLHNKNFAVDIGVAGYPCPHPESESYEEDRGYTLKKLRAGADFVVTQLFFDVREYFELVEWLRSNGNTRPIIPGILPIQSFASLRRVLSMCGSSIPARLYLELEDADRRGGEEAVRKAGIDFAVEQITRLLVGGAPGIHLYTLNKAELCLKIAAESGLA